MQYLQRVAFLNLCFLFSLFVYLVLLFAKYVEIGETREFKRIE